MITSTDYLGRTCTLVHEHNGTPVFLGDNIEARRGSAVCTGGRAPHKPGSSGKVWTEDGGEFFPHVFDLKWEAR
jgi:hypothetical protein